MPSVVQASAPISAITWEHSEKLKWHTEILCRYYTASTFQKKQRKISKPNFSDNNIFPHCIHLQNIHAEEIRKSSWTQMLSSSAVLYDFSHISCPYSQHYKNMHLQYIERIRNLYMWYIFCILFIWYLWYVLFAFLFTFLS